MSLLTAAEPAASDPGLTGIAGFVVDVVERLGAPGIGVMVALESIFPPIPSEVVLPLGGFLAGRGRAGVVEVVVWATLGSIVGALVLYAVGAVFGERRVRALVARIPLVDVADVDRGRAWFDHHGDAAVLGGRMIPGVRSLISLPAGIERMPLGRFVALTTLGSLGWNALLVGLGYVLGERWETVGRWSDVISNGIVLVLIGAIGIVALRRWRSRRQGRGDSADGGGV